MPKVFLSQLGCPKNLIDGERMLGSLVRAGYEVVGNPEEADVLLVNTCGFILPAKEESIEAILEAGEVKRRTGAKLVVVGCLAQRYKKELEEELPEADLILGLEEEKFIALHIDGLLGRTPSAPSWDGRYRLTPKHTAYLKLSEGCDNRCTYCTIPLIRGPARSVPLEEVLKEARKLADGGARELILVAQDVANYGVDIYGRPHLVEVLEELHKIEGIKWIRLLYAHPAHVDEGLVRAFRELPKLVPYLDMPVQHISDRILRRMGRRVTGGRIRELIAALREDPDFCIRTTVLVGFPGETEEEFRELLKFIEEAEFDRLGAFAYSKEEGTPAASLPDQIPDEVRNGRLEEVMRLQQEVSLRRNRRWVGRTLEVLVEGEGVGRSFRDAPEVDGVVYFDGEAEVGKFVEVRIEDVDPYDLYGVREARC